MQLLKSIKTNLISRVVHHLLHPIHLLKKIETVFKRVFDSKKGVGETNDYAFETVRREIRELTREKIGKSTVESFYYGKGGPKYSTVMSIMRWVESKKVASSVNNNNNNNASSANNNNENNMG